MGDEEDVQTAAVDAASPDTSRKRARLALVGSQQAPPRTSMLHNSRIRAFETVADLQAVDLNVDALVDAEKPKMVVDSRTLAVQQGKPFQGLVFSHVVSEKPVVLEEALKNGGARVVKEEARLAGEHVDYIVTRL